MAKILVVDDEQKMAKLVAATLEDANHSVTACFDGAQALALLSKENYDLVITDLKMPSPDGLEILKLTIEKSPETGVILMTAYASVESAVTAMKTGAYDYLIKPFDTDELVIVIDRYLKMKHSEVLAQSIQSDYEKLAMGEFIGKSKSVQELFSLINKVAKRDATVLLLGESGTGKELLANMIHKRSPRSSGPFIALNCAALSETLLESELFGHEKGAFTGAIKRKPGRFELARGGTLFLDEIGEISPAMQAKLLRVLELGQFVPVGGTEQMTADVRIIAATNRDLKMEIDQSRFREDLYFRLSVFPINIPPLRQRKEDIPLLAEYFIKRFGHPQDSLSDGCFILLQSYPFPGNVRELKNILERASILADGERITPDLLGIIPEEETTCPSGGGLTDIERKTIIDALNQAEGNKTRAAEILKITRRRLYSRMKIYDIQRAPGGTFK